MAAWQDCSYDSQILSQILGQTLKKKKEKKAGWACEGIVCTQMFASLSEQQHNLAWWRALIDTKTRVNWAALSGHPSEVKCFKKLHQHQLYLHAVLQLSCLLWPLTSWNTAKPMKYTYATASPILFKQWAASKIAERHNNINNTADSNSWCSMSTFFLLPLIMNKWPVQICA